MELSDFSLGEILAIAGIFITILGIITTGAYKIGNYVARLNQHNTQLENLDDDLKKVQGDVGDIKQDIGIIKEKIGWLEKLKKIIEGITHDDGSSYFSANSPLLINKKGKKIAKEINVKEVIDRLYPKFSKQLKKEFPKKNNPSLYDIQNSCFDIGKSIFKDNLLLDTEIKKIKEYAFQEGYKTIDGFYTIFSLSLRDKFFNEQGYEVLKIDDELPTKEQLSKFRGNKN